MGIQVSPAFRARVKTQHSLGFTSRTQPGPALLTIRLIATPIHNQGAILKSRPCCELLSSPMPRIADTNVFCKGNGESGHSLFGLR